MSSAFATTFSWWRGSETQFLRVMQIFLSMPDNKGWMEEYHRFRIMAQLFGKLGHNDPASHLLNTVIEASSNTTASSFFNWGQEIYAQPQFGITPPSHEEILFLGDLYAIDNYCDKPFHHLWDSWRNIYLEVK